VSSRLLSRIKHSLGLNIPLCEVQLKPTRTPPNQNETLLLQPEGPFLIQISSISEDELPIDLDIQIPDPFEVRTSSLDSGIGWDFDKQKLSVTQGGEDKSALMKTRLPSKYRGQKEVDLFICECPNGKRIASLKVRCDGPAPTNSKQ